MRVGASFDQIFPIRDAAAAQFMRLKAECLFRAGVISGTERCEVYLRSAALLELSAEVSPTDASVLPDWMPTDVLREPLDSDRMASVG
jgi:hypothetical protein